MRKNYVKCPMTHSMEVTYFDIISSWVLLLWWQLNLYTAYTTEISGIIINFEESVFQGVPAITVQHEMALYLCTVKVVNKQQHHSTATPAATPQHYIVCVTGVVVIHKANDKVCICVDLTRLMCTEGGIHYRQWIRPYYTIYDQTLTQLVGAKIFSKMDVNSGFWQIPLSPESAVLTTFITLFGHFCFHWLPFEIMPVPDTSNEGVTLFTGQDHWTGLLDWTTGLDNWIHLWPTCNSDINITLAIAKASPMVLPILLQRFWFSLPLHEGWE